MNTAIAIIGNGVMTYDCARILNMNNNIDLQLIISDPKQINSTLSNNFDKYCSKHSINYVSTSNLHSADIINKLKSLNLDYIFSIDNFSILKKSIYKLPKRGTINFHNSPLPRYRGANAQSWAIINDEKIYGVTWHFVDNGVDTGDIAWQTTFKLDKNETARSLIIKCVSEGTRLLKNNLTDLLNNNIEHIKQASNGSTYTRRNIPNYGYISIEWPARKIDCFVRGLDFRPFRNPFVDAKLKLENEEFIVHKISALNSLNDSVPNTPGTTLNVSRNGINIACGDGVIKIESISDLENNKLEFSSLDLYRSSPNSGSKKSAA